MFYVVWIVSAFAAVLVGLLAVSFVSHYEKREKALNHHESD